MEPASVDRPCPTCGHALPRTAEVCPKCGRDDTNPFVSPVVIPAPEHRASGRLVLGLSVIVGVGVLMGLVAPGVAIVWTVFATPTLVRAAAVTNRRREAGLPVIWEDRVQALMASTGVTLLAGIAACGAFVAACTVGLPLTVLKIGIYCAFGLGFVAAGAAGFFTMKRFWPRKITEAKNG